MIKKIILIIGALSLASCGRAILTAPEAVAPSEAARQLLEESQLAHGGQQYRSLRDIRVRYDGKWAAIGPRFQPILADTDYRQTSTEYYHRASNRLFQQFRGPGGEKWVLRSPMDVEVEYFPTREVTEKMRRGAAMVADVFRLFLLGPYYFMRDGVQLYDHAPGIVGDKPVFNIFAKLTPGFGFSERDFALISIDPQTKFVRRIRFTLNGFSDTRGAEVEVTFSKYKEIDGVIWPTHFIERVKAPVAFDVHEWWIMSLETNIGVRDNAFAEKMAEARQNRVKNLKKPGK